MRACRSFVFVGRDGTEVNFVLLRETRVRAEINVKRAIRWCRGVEVTPGNLKIPYGAHDPV